MRSEGERSRKHRHPRHTRGHGHGHSPRRGHATPPPQLLHERRLTRLALSFPRTAPRASLSPWGPVHATTPPLAPFPEIAGPLWLAPPLTPSWACCLPAPSCRGWRRRFPSPRWALPPALVSQATQATSPSYGSSSEGPVPTASLTLSLSLASFLPSAADEGRRPDYSSVWLSCLAAHPLAGALRWLRHAA